MSYGSPWSEKFLQQLSDKEVRKEFVADQMRARLALLIRSLREQPDRNWTQAELGERAGKPQNVISRFEDPNYGKMSLQSLFDLAAAFDLPVWIDMPEWDEWIALIADIPSRETHRAGFDLDKLTAQVRSAAPSEASAVEMSGAAASAAAEAIKNMVLGPQRVQQLLSRPLNANALLASNELPLEKPDSAMGNAVVARNAAA
jgi:transcriptional regulator with XRE-family HTH domain